MAEIVTTHNDEGSTIHEGKQLASNSKANAALSLGIIGTALGGLCAIGGLGNIGGLWGNGSTKDTQGCKTITEEEQYLERSQAQLYIDITKQYYEGKLQGNRELTQAFFDAYKRDVDNSFNLYKYTRDTNDATNQKIVDSSFQLYKNNRDTADILNAKIAEVDKKVDVMAAVRPYQDALIDAKINQNALMSDFNLARRTCRMIEGQLVLPSTPIVSGFGSYSMWTCPQQNV